MNKANQHGQCCLSKRTEYIQNLICFVQNSTHDIRQYFSVIKIMHHPCTCHGFNVKYHFRKHRQEQKYRAQKALKLISKRALLKTVIALFQHQEIVQMQ